MLQGPLHHLAVAILANDSSDLTPIVREVLEQPKLTDNDKISLFHVLPRHLAADRIMTFLEAESKQGVKSISESLISTSFSHVKPTDRVRVLSHVALTLATESNYAEAVYAANLEIVASASKEVDTEKHALAAIVFAINSPSVVMFEDLLDVLTNKALIIKDKVVLQLITLVQDVLVGGSGVSGYQAFLKSTGDDKFFEKLGATGIVRKSRLISISSVLSGKTRVTFAEAAAAIQAANDDEVENAVMDASLAGVVSVRVDHSKKEILVFNVAPLRFDEAAWKSLSAKIATWTAFVDERIATYEQAKN